jgi:putative ABC transport system permease protein
VSIVLATIDTISLVLLGILALVIANTIATAVRERTREYAAMRAIGFLPIHIATCVGIEGLALGLFSAVLGLALSFPLVQQGLGHFIEENMGGIFPFFRIAGSTAILAICLPAVAALSASILPAYRASRMSVAAALRPAE